MSTEINMEELMDKLIDPNDFEVLEKLGKGAYGEVFKVKEGSKFYAMKKIEEYNKTNYIREIAILARLDFPSILGFRGFALPYNKQPAIIVTEYLSGGDLTTAVKKHPAEWTDTKKMINIYGIAKGMEYCHAHKVLHRDLKPDNVLLDSRYEPHIADFGLSKLTNPDETMLQTIEMGTPVYSAPEFLSDNVGDEKMDVYSFAVLVYFIMSGKEPFQKTKNQFTYINYITGGQRDEIPEKVPDIFRALIEQCWVQVPEERPKFSQIVPVLAEVENYDEDFIKLVDVDEFLEYKERIDNAVRLDSEKEAEEEKKEEAKANEEDEKMQAENNKLIEDAQRFYDEDEFAKAAKLYAKAADNKDPRGYYHYAKLLKMGAGVIRSLPLAQMNFENVAQGDSELAVPALVEIGNIYELMDEKENAIQTYEKAMEKGSDKGRSNYARMLAYGLGKEADIDKAIELLNKSIENNDELAMAILGKLYLDGNGVPKDEKRAIELFERSSSLNSPEGNNELAFCYLDGKGVEPDMKKANYYFTQSADASNVVGLINLAKMVNKGLGIKKDFKYSIDLLHRASRLGSIEANIIAGDFFVAKGKEKNAFKCFKKAADAGNATAQMMTGKMYRYGAGVDLDYSKAVSYLKMAADKDEPEAMQLLGRCYEEGQGVDQNLEEALDWFRRSAELNFVTGIDCYARLLLEGIGMEEPNPSEAIKMFKKAAELGSDASAFNLAIIYNEGETKGIECNKKEALKYFQIAMDAGNQKAALQVAKLLKDDKGGIKKDAKKSAEILQKIIDESDDEDLKVEAMADLASIHFYKQIPNSDQSIAAKYFTIVADKGNTFAQRTLGYMYETGTGVHRDLKEAKKYYAMSAEKGDKYSVQRLAQLK